MANRPSPDWQVCHTTYIPLIVLAEPGGLYATYHLLGEPETTIDPLSIPFFGDHIWETENVTRNQTLEW